MSDPQIRDRLRQAADPLDVGSEPRLLSVRATAHARMIRRRLAGLAAGVAVAALVAVIAVAMWPSARIQDSHVPAGGPGLTGTIAYMSYDGTNAFARSDTLGGSDAELFPDPNGWPVRFSPDGSHVAYPDGSGITVANADGSAASQVADGLVSSAAVPAVSWSPDGSRIAFIANPDASGTAVSIVDVSTNAVTTLPDSKGYLWSTLAWSPDGKDIALDGVRIDSGADPGLFLLPVNGGRPVPLKAEVTTEFMDWSPDGSELALSVRNVPFPADRGDYGWDIAVIRPDGTGYRQLTDTPTWENFPVWSPDGTWIAFSSDRDASRSQLQANGSPDATIFGGVGVYVMRPDGSDVQALMSSSDGGFAIATDWRS